MTPAQRKAVFQLGSLLGRSFTEVLELPDYELDQWMLNLPPEKRKRVG